MIRSDHILGRAVTVLVVTGLIAMPSLVPSWASALICGAGTASGSNCIVYLTSGTSWTVPYDWDSSSNTIEVIGGGANGGGSSGMSGGDGGGGGAYSKVTNVTLTPSGTVTYAVGGAGGDTYFCNSTSNCANISGTAVQVGAKGGSGTSGGSSASGVGTTKYSGGSGGGGSSSAVGSGGGGGGAAGLHGAGGNGSGGSGGTCSNHGGGSGGTGDSGNTSAGANGTQWDATHGSGGGGSGGGVTNIVDEFGESIGCNGSNGSDGGRYGAGGGGGGAYHSNQGGTSSGGAGHQGVIVITYAPVPGAHSTVTLTKAANVTGYASVIGALSKGSGTFVIDHPLDPKNKLLYHSFVESPDVLNIYDGIATLDKNGEATIELPKYFLALNKDFQYLATAIGQPMPDLHLSKEVRRRFFGLFGKPVIKISGGAPDGRVSWQVTGIRHDPFIEAHPIVPEVEKGPQELVDKGEYLFPELYKK